ncbi:MAG: DUF3298 domain-containing protein [Saprospiraceae bacterium]|nr:DUF3298 domain-containing protein [Saprospiraceae bacterium]
MRFTLNCYVVLLALGLLVACKNNPSTPKNTPSVSEASVDKKHNNYRHFRGTVGEFPITMDIVETRTLRNNIFDLLHISGFYSYDKYQEPLSLYGSIDEKGMVELEESGQGTAAGVFKGTLNSDSTFTGIWRDESKKTEYKFSLRQMTNDGAIALDVYPFEDSLKLFENKPNSPQAEFSLDALLPAKNTEDSLFTFLRTQIFKTLKGDSLAQDYSNLQLRDIQRTVRDSFFNAYKTELKDEIPDSLSSVMLNHAQSTSMEVVSNTDGLLSLGFQFYTYGGGAHGNHGTQLVTYDIKNKKILTLDDVFKPNYKAGLNAAIMRAARRYFGVKPNKSLEGSALVATVEANDNYAIGRKGILFQYNPYEIASYAQGEIQLFVPFEDIKGLLK